MRWLLLSHRWLGIAVGWLVALWCASGIVMMYGGYPSLTPQDRYAGLAPFDQRSCCGALQWPEIDGDLPIGGFRLEQVLDAPRLTLDLPWGHAYIDLEAGQWLDEISPQRARAIALRYMRAIGLAGTLSDLGTLERDQWTLGAEYAEDRPLHHFAVGDAAATELYVSATSGDVVLRTTRRERLVGWLGPVVHWIYPQRLRANAALWVDVIIATTLLASFLIVLGLYVGVRHITRRRTGRWSPYRGAALWHHYAGLLFGVLALTWIVSGLLSVNPWGLLEGGSRAAAAERVAGPALTAAAVAQHLAVLAAHGMPPGTVSLEGARLDGDLAYIAYDATGHPQRLDAVTLDPAPLTAAELDAAAQRVAGDAPILDAERLERGDSYYFSDRAGRRLPIYRVVVADADRTRYYLDTVSGRLLQQYDRQRRGYRWLFEGLHRFDFAAGLRQRPLWDILMLLALGGVGIASCTGTYLGLRRLLR